MNESPCLHCGFPEDRIQHSVWGGIFGLRIHSYAPVHADLFCVLPSAVPA